MIIINRGQCTYYIKEESIVLNYNLQNISYNVYTLQNRKRFKDFKVAILESEKNEYGNINDIISLATKFGLIGMVGRKPTITDNDTILD